MVVPILLLPLAVFPQNASHEPAQHHSLRASAAEQAPVVSGLVIPDVELTNQEGQKVRFYSDLVKGRIVAINTIFTTCTTICPVMGANFAKLRELLAQKGEDAHLISISIDPQTDTPERLKQWSRQFGHPSGQGWTLVTGSRFDVDRLLKSLQVFAPDKVDHAPTILVGGEGTGDWTRASSLLSPDRLVELIQARHRAVSESVEDASTAAAHNYFTDVELLTQDGKPVRLYSDLLKGKVVVINSFFGTCTGACPRMSGVLAGLQEHFSSRLGKDVFFLSFSVDPEADTSPALMAYANQFHARPGWLFLTGSKKNVDLALAKLGQKVSNKEDHLTTFIVGNNKTGLWKKVFAPGCTTETLKTIVDSVLNDKV